MDTFEFTKIAGAVLSALLLIVATKVLIDANRPLHIGPEKDGYTLPAPAANAPASAAAEGAASEPAAETFDAAAVVAKVAAASAENGAGVFKRCGACHVAGKTAKSTVGPNLWGIVGRPRGSYEDYLSKYSEAMKSKTGPWTYLELAEFMHKPMTYVSGTKMSFQGIKDPGEIADLLAYLRTTADSPAPLPQ